MNGKGRFTTYQFKTGAKYVFDKWIFRSVVISMILLFVGAWALDGFGNPLFMNFKIKCTTRTSEANKNTWDVSGCENPLYQNERYRGYVPEEIINMDRLPGGFSYGKNNFLADTFMIWVIVFILAGFIYNHKKYNKGFKFKEYLNVNIEEIKKEGTDEVKKDAEGMGVNQQDRKR